MPADAIKWPVKTREIHNHHFNSEVWNGFKFRDDDIIISTWAKSGTTWMQQIVGQLIFHGDETVDVASLSPWVDLRVEVFHDVIGRVEAQSNRRFLKTHLYVDALVMSPKAKYIYVGRDGRDVIMSMYHHHANANQLWYDALNKTPGLVGPEIGPPDPDVTRYFADWVNKDGHPWWPFWEHVQGWYDINHLPNVLLVHYNDLKADMEGEMRRIAKFLDIAPTETEWAKILEHCSFDYMKANADRMAPLGGAVFEGGGKTFINKGVNGRWRDVIPPDLVARYEQVMAEKLTPECARWLTHGGHV